MMMFWMTTSVTILLTTATLIGAQVEITECTFDADTCGCKTDQGYISLKQYENKPLYVQDTSKNYDYHWNPCKDFTMGSITAACIQHIPNGDDYDCGTHKSTKTSVEDGNAVFQLEAADAARQSKINCVCKTDAVDSFEFQGELPEGTYDFQLMGESCCPRLAPSTSEETNGLSPGSILLIIFLVGLVVYLIGGVAFQTGIRKARGKESLPNINFWTALPGLIKEGFRFTFSFGKEKSYERI